MALGEQLDEYFAAEYAVHEAFGYREDWCVFPLEDRREYWWRIPPQGDEGGSYDIGVVKFWSERSHVDEWSDTDGYSDDILPNRHLPKSVYEGDGFTMILVDTHTDGNRFLAIFDNAKRVG